jgi:hypothetical protein
MGITKILQAANSWLGAGPQTKQAGWAPTATSSSGTADEVKGYKAYKDSRPGLIGAVVWALGLAGAYATSRYAPSFCRPLVLGGAASIGELAFRYTPYLKGQADTYGGRVGVTPLLRGLSEGFALLAAYNLFGNRSRANLIAAAGTFAGALAVTVEPQYKLIEIGSFGLLTSGVKQKV